MKSDVPKPKNIEENLIPDPEIAGEDSEDENIDVKPLEKLTQDQDLANKSANTYQLTNDEVPTTKKGIPL